MAVRSRSHLKARFQTGDKPTEADFTDLIDSMSNVTAEPYALTTQIGIWNMDSTISVTVVPDPAYFNLATMVGFFVTIVSDAGVWESWGTSSSTDLQARYEPGTGFILVSRTGGHFDGTGYDSAVQNRGFITTFHTAVPT